MNKIDISNVEAYLLDYAEGNLSSEDCAELILFLSQNTQISFDLSEIKELPKLNIEEIPANFKAGLIKGESDIRERFEQLCISFYNKEISSIDKNELDHLLIQFPLLEKEFLAFSNSYLQEDLSINFQGKEGLKKQFNIQGSFDDLCVKEIEGNLTEIESAQLVDIIFENEELSKEKRAFQHAILKKEEIIYPNKSDLYKNKLEPKILLLWSARIAVAAGLLLVMGIFFFNQDSTNKKGLAFIPADTISAVRGAESKPKSENKIEELNEQKNRNSDAYNKLNTTNKDLNKRTEITLENSLATLNSKKALTIKKFELPSEYIALKPSELVKFNETPVAYNSSDDDFLKPQQLIWQQITRVLKKNKIDIESPIEEVRKDGFAEVGYRSLERASRGSLVIERESHESKSKITGIQLFGIGFSRSSQ